jgi:hypothetical protein
MLFMLILAETTYLLAVLLQSTGWVYMTIEIPWIVGYGTCGLLDCFLVWQYFHFPASKPPRNNNSRAEGIVPALT